MKRKNMIAVLAVMAAMAMTVSACGSTVSSVAAQTAASENTAEDGNSAKDSTDENSRAEENGEAAVDSATLDSEGENNGKGEEPPEKPDGEIGSEDGSNDSEKPGNPPDGKGGPGNGETPDGKGGPGENGQGGPGGADTQTYDYTGETSGALTADGSSSSESASDSDKSKAESNSKTSSSQGSSDDSVSEKVISDGETITTSTADQNAALAKNGGTLTVTKGTLKKSGDDTDGDNCNFYGINSIVLSVGDGSTAYISNSKLSADSEGSNAMFATDSGKIYAYKDTINTTAGNSRGLDATYGGTVVADSMEITTKGDHCAALATDRGGGNISVTNSTLSTSGSGSPLLYSTGDIEVDNVTGTASGSQIAGMEGLNTILIHNSNLSSTITSKTASDPVANGIIIYQSTSGDAETTTGETATFQAVDSTLSSDIEEGSMFYVTNTQANILLSNTKLDFDSDKANLLTIEGNDSNNWGSTGSNGGTVTFTARNEVMNGDISVDSISSLDLYLLDGTTYTGAMEITENEDATDDSAADAPITVNIDADSTWVVTANTTISNLNAEKGASIVDEDGRIVTIVANGKTVVKGTSDVTVTVTGSYGTTVSTGDANEVSTDFIDRSDFDSYYGTSTAFGEN